MANRRIPGPRGRFLLGNLREFRQDLLGFLTQLADDYGDVAAFRLGPRRAVLLNDPDHIERVLVTENRKFKKHFAIKLLRPVLGLGLLTSEGDHWLRQRRLIQPAFRRESLLGYTPTMFACAERLLSHFADGEVRDIHADMMSLALDVAGRTLMGLDVERDAPEIEEWLDLFMLDFRRKIGQFWHPPPWLPTPANIRSRRAMKTFNGIVRRLIEERRASGPRDDLLSMLLAARGAEGGRRMTDRELRDETVTLLLAGHETTANALSWTWYLLALHPELQERVSNEAEAVAHGRPLSAEDLPRLKFAEQVLKESMRLYPPAFIIGREATAAFAAGEYVIPRGATVFLSQWVSHRDSRRFPDPQEFRPERWTTQFEAMLPRYAYFPFGGGPRVCVGNTFAMIEAVLLLSTLARHWRFELAGDEPIGLLPTVTLRPDQPIWMRLTQRTASPHASSEPQRHTITET